MSALGKIEDWRWKFFLWAGLPLIAVIGLYRRFKVRTAPAAS